jgi:kynurenine formamidase
VDYRPYAQLPVIGDDDRHAWDVFGADDELGCLNFIGTEQVVAAAREVRHGEVINLDLALDEPQPQFWSSRSPYRRSETVSRASRDDRLDGFFLQGSTQWDALNHFRYREHGYFGGRTDEDLTDGGQLGIDRVARKGIVARGVLLDVAECLRARGTPVDPADTFRIGVDELEATLAHQSTELRDGDVILIRTGWLEWYRGLDAEVRLELATRLAADRSQIRMPGLDADRETIAWLWDHRLAAAAMDTPTFDALPFDRSVGWAHQRLIPLLGFYIGELWDLEQLAEQCRAVGTHSFMLTSSPLNLPQGNGSPANAYAVF